MNFLEEKIKTKALLRRGISQGDLGDSSRHTQVPVPATVPVVL